MQEAKFIEGLRLADVVGLTSPFADLETVYGPIRSSTEPGTDAAPTPGLPDDLKAAVDVGSLLSFVDGVTTAERDDVLYSVQLAQRGASGVYDRYADTENWYKKYIEILETLGWSGEQFTFVRYDSAKGNVSMDSAALEVIAAFASQNQLAVLNSAIEALAKLADGENAIGLFDFYAAGTDGGNFQIGAVQKSDNDSLSLALGAYLFENREVKRRFLFVTQTTDVVQFWTGAQKMTFNRVHYDGLRELVQRKLGDSATRLISALTI